MMKWMIPVLLIALGACEKKQAETTPASTNAAMTQTNASDTPAQKGVAKWEIAIVGHEMLAGDSVRRKERSEGGESVTLFGTPAMIRIDVTSKGSVEDFNLGVSADNFGCFYDAETSGSKLQMQTKGERTELDGEVSCGPLDAPSERKPAKISAWYTGRLKTLPKMREARDFKPGEKVVMGKDGPKAVEEDE